jgi:hypothetical protein
MVSANRNHPIKKKNSQKQNIEKSLWITFPAWDGKQSRLPGIVGNPALLNSLRRKGRLFSKAEEGKST